MKCLYCGSQHTELKSVVKEGDKTYWIVECNRCASVSRIVGKPVDSSDEQVCICPRCGVDSFIHMGLMQSDSGEYEDTWACTRHNCDYYETV